jgi:hypothetical protein
MPVEKTTTVAAHLKNVPAAVRPILVAARRTITSAAPKAEEIPYQSSPPKSASAMWKLARYSLDGEEVVGLGTFARHSTIYFYRGRELEDTAGLLQGTGKDTRFVTLRSASDAEKPAVKKLVREAFRLGGRQASR